MDKSLTTREWEELVTLLRELRRKEGLGQADLARLLGRPQSLVSDIEKGQRRVDVYELRVILGHLGLTLGEFIDEWESRLQAGQEGHAQ